MADFGKITRRGAPFEAFEVVDVIVYEELFTGGPTEAIGKSKTTASTIPILGSGSVHFGSAEVFKLLMLLCLATLLRDY